jgi:hypothetical protein
MSAQTPQTDALVIAADGCKSVYPGEEFKPNPDWKFEPEIDAIIALARTLEADRDRLKALCEELREALKYARRFMKADSDIAYVDIAVMKADHALKAQKDI